MYRVSTKRTGVIILLPDPTSQLPLNGCFLPVGSLSFFAYSAKKYSLFYSQKCLILAPVTGVNYKQSFAVFLLKINAHI